jgi:hypothetical protein
MGLKILNILFFVIMVVMNYLANALPINNKTTGELSDQYPNLFVPAGITFSIWGVIYLLLFVFILLQFREQNNSIVRAIGWAFIISCALNATWILSWHYQQLPLSLLIMLALLASLVYINHTLTVVSGGFFKITFGIYLGWICIATIANVTTLLVYYNWNGWGIPDYWWAITMIAVGTLITFFAMLKLNNPFIALAVIWAFVGIIIKRQTDYVSIVMTAIAGIVVLLSAVFAYVYFYRKQLLD